MTTLVPERLTPDAVGEVCWQAVAFVEDQVYVNVSPGLRVIGPSEPFTFTSTVGVVDGAAGSETVTESV